MTLSDFFTWAKAQGYDDKRLALRLGYDPATVWRIRTGSIKSTTDFAIRCIVCFGPDVEPLFSSVVVLAGANNDRCIEVRA